MVNTALAQDCCSTCQDGMIHSQSVELPAARGSEPHHSCPEAAAFSLRICALAAGMVLPDSADMKSSPSPAPGLVQHDEHPVQQLPLAMLSITRQTSFPLNCSTIKHLNLRGNKKQIRRANL